MSVRLPADVYSPDHIGIVLWELGQLISQLQNASNRAVVVADQASQEEVHISAFLMSVLHGAGVASNDTGALEQLQGELRTLRDRGLTAHIIVAAMPTRAFKRELVGWFRSQVDAHCLLTFAVRGDIGGGFILRIGSKQYDFTYRAQLREDRHRLTEIFDGV